MVTPKKRKPNHPSAINGACQRPHLNGMFPKLLSLNVPHPIWILHKTLERTDLDTCEGRLLLTSKKVAPTPLLGILTDTERASVREKTGLKVRSFDRFGREYNMVFKFLQCNGAYRMIGDWSRFLRENGGKMQVGDGIEIWAFRIPKGGENESESEIGMSLLHYEKDEDLYRCSAAEGSLDVNGEQMEVSPSERAAVEALLQLQMRVF